MRIKEIKNLDGEVIFTYDEDNEGGEHWDEYDFSGANLERANLEGIVWKARSSMKLCVTKRQSFRKVLMQTKTV